MSAADLQVISLDLEEDDLLYRIRKGDRFVYVEIKTPSLIPESDRTESSAILKHLRSLPCWNAEWETLTVTGQADAPQCRLDTFQPHRLTPSDVDQGENMYDLNDIEIVERISDRIFKAKQDNHIFVVKIARFRHEIRYLRQEVRAYKALQLQGFDRMPSFYGYVYEEHHDRVMGFAMEFLRGRHAGPDDLEACRDVLNAVHTAGWILGDLNRYNWMKTEDGMKVFDFEASLLLTDTQLSPADELSALPGSLGDDSSLGHR